MPLLTIVQRKVTHSTNLFFFWNSGVFLVSEVHDGREIPRILSCCILVFFALKKGPGMKTLLQYWIMNGTPVEVFGFPSQYITLAAIIPRFRYGYGVSAAQPSVLDFVAGRSLKKCSPKSARGYLLLKLPLKRQKDKRQKLQVCASRRASGRACVCWLVLAEAPGCHGRAVGSCRGVRELPLLQ